MKLIVTARGNSYCVFGETLDRKEYPTIEVGSTIFVPELEKMLIVTDNESFIDLETLEKVEVEETVTPEDEVTETAAEPEEQSEEPEVEEEVTEE